MVCNYAPAHLKMHLDSTRNLGRTLSAVPLGWMDGSAFFFFLLSQYAIKRRKGDDKIS